MSLHWIHENGKLALKFQNMRHQVSIFPENAVSNNNYPITMSQRPDKRVFQSIAVKKLIIELRVRKKTITEIGAAVYKEFQIY